MERRIEEPSREARALYTLTDMLHKGTYANGRELSGRAKEILRKNRDALERRMMATTSDPKVLARFVFGPPTEE